MDLKEQLERDLKDAMRAKDQTRLLTIRSIRSAIIEKEKEGTGPVSDDDLAAIVQKQAKQRRDAMQQYDDAGRDDLAQKERDELAILAHYLPKQLSDADIHRTVQDIVTRTGATSMKDMGRVMGEVMSELKGQADGNRVRVVVQNLLKA
ncbi:MAG: GatB/YqeY domain-containing protein [Rhodothermales bacterium]